MVKVLSNSKIIRQIGTHKTQCVHRMGLPLFVPQDESDDRQVNQRDLYPHANAVEDADIFDETLPSVPDEGIDEEPEEKIIEVNPRNETQPYSDV